MTSNHCIVESRTNKLANKSNHSISISALCFDGKKFIEKEVIGGRTKSHRKSIKNHSVPENKILFKKLKSSLTSVNIVNIPENMHKR